MIRILTALLLLLTPPAMAQGLPDADIRLDRLVPGTTHLYQSTERGAYSLTYRHGENGGFVIEQRDGTDPVDGPLTMTIHTDTRGRWLRQIAGETEIRFEPHNCLRSLVYCEYEAFINDQPAFPMARQATLEDGIIRYELFRRDTPTPQIVQSGTVELDASGFMTRSTLDRTDGERHSIERTETLIPGPDRGPLPEPSLILR